MRKKRRIVVCFITAVSLLTGCGIGSGNETVSFKDDNITSVETDMIKQDKADDMEGKLQMLTDNTWQKSYSSEDGWYYINDAYEIEENDDRLPSVMYVDYKSGKSIYLCNKLNCRHNSYKCNAVLPKEADRENTLFGQGGYLYIVSTDYDQSGSMSSGMVIGGENSEDEPRQDVFVPTIYRMKLDGTEREKIMELESGIVLESTFLGDGKNIYGIQKKVKYETKDSNTYATGCDRELVKIDLQNKKIEKVIDLDNDSSILGGNERNIVIGTMDFGRTVTTEDKQKDDSLYKKAKYRLKSVNIDSGKEVELKVLKEKYCHREMVSGSKLYISNEKEKKVDVIDFVANKSEKIKTDIPLSIDNIIQDKSGKDILYCIAYDSYGRDEKSWDYYLVNTESGKTIKGELKNSEKAPIEIIAQNKDSLFVLSDYKNVNEYVAWMDINQEVIGEQEYSMISKDNYINNKANFKKVKMIGMKK